MPRPLLLRVSTLGLISCFSLTTIPAPTFALSDTDGSALLSRHRSFVGWTTGDGTLSGWHVERTHEVRVREKAAGDHPEFVTWNEREVRRGVIYRDTETENPSLETNTGFTGRAFWDTDYDNNLVVLLEEHARRASSLSALLGDTISDLPASRRNPVKIDDATFDVARVVVPAGFTVDLYVAPDGAYRRALIDPDGIRLELNVDSYVEAMPGKRIIGSYHFGSGRPYTFVKVEANPTIADADLLPPAPRTHWTFGSGNGIPLEVVRHTSAYGQDAGRAVQVRATINGHEGTFLFDSGAWTTLIFQPFADSLGGKELGPAVISGIYQTLPGTWISVSELKLGDDVLHDAIVAKTSGDFLPGVDGILGFDILARAIVDVDLDSNRLTVLDPSRFAPSIGKGASAFPVDLSTHHAEVHVSIGNGVDAKPIFDTGDDFLVLLSDQLRSSGKVTPLDSDFMLPNGLRVNPKMAYMSSDGSLHVVPCARLSLMMVGPFRYENSTVCWAAPGLFGADGGLIGFDFLRHFNWTFDYPDRKIVLTPNGQK